MGLLPWKVTQEESKKILYLTNTKNLPLKLYFFPSEETKDNLKRATI